MRTDKFVMYGCVVQAVMKKLLIVWTCYMLVVFLNTIERESQQVRNKSLVVKAQSVYEKAMEQTPPMNVAHLMGLLKQSKFLLITLQQEQDVTWQ